MSEALIGLLGGFVGSSLTVLVTKILEIKQKKIEHKATLRKEFYLKKVVSMEKAVAQWWIVISNLNTIVELFQAWKEGHELDENTEAIVIGNVDKQMKKLEDMSYNEANSIFLYFDLDVSEYLSSMSAKELFGIFGEINEVKIQLENLSAESENEQEILEKKAEELIDKIVEEFNSIKNEFSKLIQKFRIEMEKYEE